MSTLQRTALRMEDGMTLGEATELLRMGPWACACSGPPCCINQFRQARRLRRAAHITVKLISDTLSAR